MMGDGDDDDVALELCGWQQINRNKKKKRQEVAVFGQSRRQQGEVWRRGFAVSNWCEGGGCCVNLGRKAVK